MCVCYQLMLHSLLCTIIPYNYPSLLQQYYVQNCHSFQTELLRMLLIWMLILMWIHWLLIPVILVSVCLDLRLECVYSEGDGLACFHLCALVRKIGYI